MGWFGSVCSFVSSAVSACVSAVSSLGSALSSFASGISAVVGAICTALPKLGEALGQFGNGLLKGLGILKPDEDMADFGEKALQAAENGVTSDKFDDFDDYVAALRNFDLDPEKAKNRSQADKLSSGMALGTVALEKKYDQQPGALNGIWLLPLANKEYFTADRVGDLVSDGKLGGDIYGYLERRLSAGDSMRMETSLTSGLKDPQTLLDALDKARDGWSDVQTQLIQKAEGKE
ncbi:MAG: hypothetical protein ACRC6D_08600 [Aeromonas sp.]